VRNDLVTWLALGHADGREWLTGPFLRGASWQFPPHFCGWGSNKHGAGVGSINPRSKGRYPSWGVSFRHTAITRSSLVYPRLACPRRMGMAVRVLAPAQESFV